MTTLWVSGEMPESSLDSEWLLWWVGDAMGDLIVAPLIFVLSTRPWRRLDRRTQVEGLVLLGLLVGRRRRRLPRRRGATRTSSSRCSSGRSSASTSSGRSRAASSSPERRSPGAVHGSTPIGDWTTTEIVQILEALTAARRRQSSDPRRRACRARSRAESELARAMRASPRRRQLAQIGSWEWDIPADRVTWSDELYRLCGPRAPIRRDDLRAVPRARSIRTTGRS